MRNSSSKKIYLFILAITILLAGLFFITKKRLNSSGYQITESQYTLENGYSFAAIQVRGMKDSELEERINESLCSCFFILEKPWFVQSNIESEDPVVHCRTEQYLSIEYRFRYLPSDTVEGNLFVCVTVDMQTGQVVFLDDLIEVDEDFALLVKEEAILNCEGTIQQDFTKDEATKYLNDNWSKKETSYILRYFRGFTKDKLYGKWYWYNNYDYKALNTDIFTTYFYLEEGRICFSGGSSDPGWMNWIMIDDIENYLKVPKW